jgi:hypothetical protein
VEVEAERVHLPNFRSSLGGLQIAMAAKRSLLTDGLILISMMKQLSAIAVPQPL